MQVKLSSLLLLTSLVGVAAALCRLFLPLGICFGVVAIPSLLRTVLVARRHHQAEAALSAMHKVRVFVVSFLISLVIIVLTLLAGFLGVVCAMALQAVPLQTPVEKIIVYFAIFIAAFVLPLVITWLFFHYWIPKAPEKPRQRRYPIYYRI
ncbi:MAG: hypothetical protein KatS3mg110_1625 [Pirellulaceae bacterium]|nr:MAG: hypothetical protein KatS3mg110_1625 [Pirellulaceae bacterium]